MISLQMDGQKKSKGLISCNIHIMYTQKDVLHFITVVIGFYGLIHAQKWLGA